MYENKYYPRYSPYESQMFNNQALIYDSNYHYYPYENQQMYPYPIYNDNMANYQQFQMYPHNAQQTYFQMPMYTEELPYATNPNLYANDEQAIEEEKRVNPFLAHFQTEDGEYDLDKIFSTAGQFIGIVRQVTPMVSQISTLVRILRPRE